MSKAWFRPKRYGYGAGLPISWEGWGLLGLYLAGVWLAQLLGMLLLGPVKGTLLAFALIAVLTAGLILIVRTRAEGGWHWRNGKE